jgi:hypothetical protein
MTDTYGAEPLPTTDGLASDWRKGERSPDRALDAIASYLQAVLPARIGPLWEQVAPGNQLIAETFTVRPQDVLLAPRQLPALFIWRGRFTQTREAEDYLVTRTQLGCMWLLWWSEPTKRERYLPFQGALAKAIHESLCRGRHPAWVVPGDTTPGAALRGSVLVQQAGLMEPIREISGDQVDVSLDPEKTGTPVHYKAFSLTIPIVERMTRDAALFTVPSIDTSAPDNANPGAGFPYPGALDLTLTQQTSNPIEVLKPKPSP